MKLFLHSGDLDEVRHERQRGVIGGVTVDESGRAGQGQGQGDSQRQAWVATLAAAATGPLFVAVGASDVAAMVHEAAALAALAANVIVALPPTPEGLEAIRRCTAQGITTQLSGYHLPAHVELGARAGAQWFTPALGPALADSDVSELVRVAVASRRTYARVAPVLAGPLRSASQAFEAGAAGAEAASVTFPVLQRLLALAPARA